MNSFFRFLFPKYNKVVPNTYWVHESNFNKVQNPFNDTYGIYKILDVKNGYVKYSYFSKELQKNPVICSNDIRSFYGFYREIPKPEWIA